MSLKAASMGARSVIWLPMWQATPTGRRPALLLAWA